MTINNENNLLERMADALDRLAPPKMLDGPLPHSEGYMWDHVSQSCVPIEKISRVPLSALQAIDTQIARLYENTFAFARGFFANNALLWGARGTGKSSLIKAVHGEIISNGHDIGIVEITREDIADLPNLMALLRKQDRRYIVFCDDLAFDAAESSYKALKAALEGGLAGRPSNIIFYATSNRRHLMARQMIDNERSTAINPSEAIEETVSLSDRFGLWIGFHSVDQEGYLSIIESYISVYQLPVNLSDIRADALQWAIERGNRSGRTAFQYITHLSATLNIKIES